MATGLSVRDRTASVLSRIGGPLVALAVVLAVARIALVWGLPYSQAVGLFDDDAFYYFGIARHIAEGDGSTFNGVDPTNGYHPLWLVLLVPVFAVLDGRGALVGVTAVSAVVMLCCSLLLTSLGRATGRPGLFTVASVPLMVCGVAGPAFFFSGMETGLLILGILAIARILARLDLATGADPGRGPAIQLGAAVAFTVLARLDSVLTLLLLGLVLAYRWRHQVRRTLTVAVVPASVLVVYLAVNRALFDTLLPVSGQAKALGDSSFNTAVLAQFGTSPVVLGRNTWLGVVAIAVVAAGVVAERRADGRPRSVTLFGLVVLVGGLLTVVYYGASSSWQLWPWYFSAAPLAIALAGPALLARVLRPGPRESVLVAVAIGVVLVVAATTDVRAVRGGVERSAFVEAGPVVAAAMSSVEPLNGPLAMGDRAGSVGFHLARPIVHLEGLVGPARYLEALDGGGVPAFLADHNVAFYGRGDADAGVPVGSGCRRFVEPQQGGGPKTFIQVCDRDLVVTVPLSDGTTYRVWRYRPDLNP